MYDETIPLSGGSTSSTGSNINYYGSKYGSTNYDDNDGNVNSKNKHTATRTSTRLPETTTARYHNHHTSSITKRQNEQQQQQQANRLNAKHLRFMVMIFTGITFFICISFVFVQSAVSVLHDRHRQNYHQQLHLDGIESENSNDNSIQQFPPPPFSSSFCCSSNSSSSCTFRQIGQIMVPSTYQALMDTIELHLFTSSGCNQTRNERRLTKNGNHKHRGAATAATAVTTTCLQPPSNVNYVRKQILLVRDLIDIFSPIYSNTTATMTDTNGATKVERNDIDDPWAVVRTKLDDGYTLIGQYQDLDHSHVRYTIDEISILQYKIIQWNNQFLEISVVQHDAYSRKDVHLSITKKVDTTTSPSTMQYLSLTTNDTTTTTWYIHAAESRLFWNGFQRQGLYMEPDNQKTQKSHNFHWPQQLQQQQQATPSMDSTAIFIVHLLFMKQVKLAKKYYIKAYQHVSIQHDSEQIDYHNLRKVLRCIVDEFNIFFTSTSYFGTVANCSGPLLFLDTSIINISIEDIRTFIMARQMLGDLNDDWNAYKFYVKHRRNGAASQHDGSTSEMYSEYSLMQSINMKWNTFKSWSTETVDLNGLFTRLLESGFQK